MPKVYRIILSLDEVRQLRAIQRGSKTSRTWQRATAILMSHHGVSAAEISTTIGVTQDSVSNYRRNWIERGSVGLFDRPHPGRPPIADDSYLKELRRALRASPRRLGFAFNVWRCARLAIYLEEKTGKRISAGHLAVILRKHGFRFRMPKHTLKGKRDEIEHDRAHRRLKRLKKGL